MRPSFGVVGVETTASRRLGMAPEMAEAAPPPAALTLEASPRALNQPPSPRERVAPVAATVVRVDTAVPALHSIVAAQPAPPARSASRLQRSLSRLHAAEDIWGLSTMARSTTDFAVVRTLSPFEALCLGSLCLFHQALFLTLFSEPGLGDELFRALAPHRALAAVGYTGVGIALLLFLLDAHLWSASWRLRRALLGLTAALAIVVGLILVGTALPWAPFLVYLFAVQALIYGLRSSLFADASMAHFYRAVAMPTAAGGAATLLGWVIWVGATRSGWRGELRASYYSSLLCDPSAPACLPAAILYFSPLACGLLNVGIGLVLHLLALWAAPERRAALPVMVRASGTAAFVSVMALYVQAAVSGADSALANSVLVLALALLLVVAVLVGSSVGWELLARKIVAIPLVRRAASKASEQLPAVRGLPPAGRAVALLGSLGDLAKALLLFGGFAPFALFLCLSALKQKARELAWLPRGASEWTEPASGMRVRRGDLLTPPARAMVEHVRAWEWSSVLPKAMYVGIVVMVMNVGFGKLLNVLNSVLIHELLRANVGLVAVCAAFFGAGFVLFMLPPVPGPAVYLLGSFLIPRFTSFWAGIALSTFLSFTLKMLTSAVQQVVIGERMGHSVTVRAFVGYNSLTMRAIRHILAQPGWSAGKLCILVGGPDWPTCVACGILKLKLLPILLGNTPQVLNIFAVTVAGGFQLRKAEGGLWLTLSSLMLGIASASLILIFAGAAHYIELAALNHREALEALPRDAAVDALDAQREAKRREYAEATAWAHPERPVPLWMRLNLVCAAALQIGSVYAAQLLGKRCFAPFEMTDSIEDELGGDWTNLFTPLGRVVLLLWAISCAQLAIFSAWAWLRVRETRRGAQSGPAEIAPSEVAARHSQQVQGLENGGTEGAAASAAGGAFAANAGDEEATGAPRVCQASEERTS